MVSLNDVDNIDWKYNLLTPSDKFITSKNSNDSNNIQNQLPYVRDTNNVCIILINIRLIRANITLINSFLIDNQFPDIIYFTETWLNEFDSAVISDITGYTFYFLHSHRCFDNMGGSIGGCVGILFETFYKYSNFKRINLDYCGGLSIDFYLQNSIKFSLFLIYRSPGFSLDDINIFLNEFSDIITSTKINDYILIGYMNFHYDTDIHPHSLYINFIDYFSLIQHNIPKILYWSYT